MKKNKIALLIASVFALSAFSGCGEDVQNETSSEIQTTEEISVKQDLSALSAENLQKPSDELYEKLKKISTACERYYSKSKKTKRFFSWAGLLACVEKDEATGKETNSEITVDTLKENGYLEDENYIKDAVLLCIKPTDFDASAKKTNLDIFTALKTTDGYCIVGKGFGQKLFTDEQFKQLVMKYNIDHGPITSPETGSEDFNLLMTAIAKFRGDIKNTDTTPPTYVVRYVSKNDLYAVVILSGTDDVTDTTEYLLKKGDNGWEVHINGLENMADVKGELNNTVTDFDLNILPPYTLYEYRKQVRTTEHYENIFTLLKEQKIIDPSDTVTYCCGTQNVLYVEFASGVKIAGGATQDGNFDCNKVDTYEDAIRELGKFVKPVPAFILKYNK